MADIVLETIRSLILVGVIVFLWREGMKRRDLSRTGWNSILCGFLLLLFGSVLDISDNFNQLNPYVVIGETEVEAFLEKIVGYLGGFLLLAIGLVRWIPTVTNVKEKERLIKELEQINRDLDGFARVASHDLKAPLRAVNNLATWIEEDASNQLHAESRQHLVQLRDRIARMDRLLDDLLEYSRVGRHHFAPERVDSAELVGEVIDLIAVPDGYAVDVAQGMPTLVTQKVLLGQVFQNLIQNALEHHHRRHGKIEISARRRGSYYEFAVTDDGPGIPREYQEKAFQMFETLGGNGEAGGTGIGLAIVSKVLESVGGRIALDSQEGQGCTFRFTWPA